MCWAKDGVGDSDRDLSQKLIMLQRDMFRPSRLNLSTGFSGVIVLNPGLKTMKNILT